ncbi:MAG: DUF1553 domain-containing protein [Candidatus Hydrogenedentes bacterium]|nr:DUF1553 domain-containing protein [Candidatus Hydrogenedentota bacterium]
MKRLSFLVLSALAGFAPAADAQPDDPSPFDSGTPFASHGELDALVLASLTARGIEPANLCADTVFLRRVYLDVIGTLPEPPEVRGFLQDARPDKRSAVIESLLEREEFADYWALKWCDVLRTKSEFPVNLWPNAVQAYHRWIREAIHRNVPYDEFARELLTSSGSNFRVPQVNFYRAVQSREPESLAAAVALTFMGVRLDTWSPEQRANLAAFFSRVAYKNTNEWKEEIVLLDPGQTSPLSVVFPDATATTIPARDDPRHAFAAWLTAPANDWFARNAVNRVWAWIFGRGIVDPADDFRPDNPPVNPELLAYLERQFVDAKYDVKHLLRMILNSSTYQQSPIPRSKAADAERYFACYPVRRLDAEVVVDAVSWLTATPVEYSSAIPEPFSFVPASERTIALADGSITSSMLELFGRPARDTGLLSERSNDPTDEQRRFLLNSSDIQRRIERSERFRRMLEATKKDRVNAIRAIYVAVLSRPPTVNEIAVAGRYASAEGVAPRQAADDLIWALINSKEFMYRH